MAESEMWAHVRQLVNEGATLDINGGGYHLNIASLYQGEQQVCMFMCREMGFDAIMDRLEKLAKRYCEEGVVTDEVNGTEHCVW
ncbi:MAG: hypothetical protein ACOC7S_02820 [Planctomycetota bacterium]